MSKPTILVVPGAWHVPEHYAAITSFMKAKGYPVICKQNRTCGTEDATMNADDDAVAIRKEIDSIDGGVIITMHSYGGVPGSVAANGAANVIGLIFISSFVIPPGSTLMDAPQNNDDSERDEFDIDVSN